MAGLALVSEVAVVSDDPNGVAQALCDELQAAGKRARVVASVDPSVFGEGAPAVIFLGGLREGDDAVAYATLQAGFRAAHAMAALATERGGVFVCVQDTGGDFGLSGSERAFFGGLSGLAKTAALEWPEASVKAIDLERGNRDAKALATALASEILAGGPELEVGLHADGRRTTLVSLEEAVTAGTLAIGAESVLVCSGGARGVTAATLIALAKKTQARIVLLGRTPLAEEPAACSGANTEADLKRALMMAAKQAGDKIQPAAIGKQVKRILAGREVRQTLAALEAAGSPARYDAVDVTDAAGVSRLLADVRGQWGPITGIVHGAGVLADKLIADKSDDQVDFVLGTKLGGLTALLEATAGDPLDTLVFFSSVAARTGNVGQCDYAMANEVLNKVAARERRRRGENVRICSLGWGPWEGGMVTPSLKRYFEEHGVPLIPLDVGAQMMLDELSNAAATSLEVVLGAPPKRKAIAGDEQAVARFDVRIDAASHPYLSDHAIEGRPVLPMVMVLEWFVRAAGAFGDVASCRDLRVLRGVTLDHYREGGDWLRVIARAKGDQVEVALCDVADERLCRYSATVTLGTAPPSNGTREPANLQPLGASIYGGCLFHGPAFQVIREVEGVSEDGIVGELDGAVARRWPSEPWRTDPAALDGGLQLALLWSEHRLGGKNLPTGLGALEVLQPGALSGPLRCLLVGHTEGDQKAVSDISFLDPEGRLVARLLGVETHQRPS